MEEKQNLAANFSAARTKQNIQSSQSFLNTYLKYPQQLVGQRFKHNITETPEDAAQWYDGTVKSVDKQLEDKIKTTYFVTYDVDGDEEFFSMPLLQDLKRGDLVFL